VCHLQVGEGGGLSPGGLIRSSALLSVETDSGSGGRRNGPGGRAAAGSLGDRDELSSDSSIHNGTTA
jgi:hypothetical protein